MVISDALWRRRFQQDRSIVGRTIPIDGVPTEIIGVMPPAFVCPPAVVLRGTPPAEPAELWIPHAVNLEAGQRGAHYLAIIGRLAPGSTIDVRRSRDERDPGADRARLPRLPDLARATWCRSSIR